MAATLVTLPSVEGDCVLAPPLSGMGGRQLLQLGSKIDEGSWHAHIVKPVASQCAKVTKAPRHKHGSGFVVRMPQLRPEGMKGTKWFFHKKYGTSAETEAEKDAAQANMKIDSWTRERAAVLVTDTACAGLDVPLYSLSKARSLGTNCLAYHATRLGVAFATDVVKEVRQRNTLPSVPKGARDPISSTARNPPLAGGVL